jgi:glycosyltransferase involved in cell wall biosynthesis
LLAPEKDARALAAAMARVLDDPVLADRLGRQGCEHVIKHYNLRRNAGALRALFEAAVGAGRPMNATAHGVPVPGKERVA